jgi:hypothetical protein
MASPWAIMDQAVGLPVLNGCFIEGISFVANHLRCFSSEEAQVITQRFRWTLLIANYLITYIKELKI